MPSALPFGLRDTPGLCATGILLHEINVALFVYACMHGLKIFENYSLPMIVRRLIYARKTGPD